MATDLKQLGIWHAYACIFLNSDILLQQLLLEILKLNDCRKQVLHPGVFLHLSVFMYLTLNFM